MSIPVYAVLIQDRGATGSAFRYTSGKTVSGGAFDTASPLLIAESIERDSDPRESRFNTSTLRFRLIDINQAVTPFVKLFAGKQCTLYSVEAGANFSTAVTRFVGIVQEFSLTENGYALSVASPVVLADKVLFDGAKTATHASINGSVTSVVVEDASAFQDSGYIRIDAERIAYTTRTDGGSTWTLGGLIRGVSGSVAATHASAAVVEELFILGPAHPFDILSSLLSDASSKTGLGMSEYVNTANFSTQKTAVGSTLEMSFEITASANAKTWMEDEILRPMGAYPYETAAGLISVKPFGGASSTSDSISDSDSTRWAQWRGNFPKRVNRVIYNYDWDDDTKKFGSTFTYRDDGLFAHDGDFPLIINSKGIHTALTDTATLLTNRSAALVDRFGLQLPTIAAVTRFSKLSINVADDVSMTFSKLIDLTDGTIGISGSPAEILSIRQHLDGDFVEFLMFAEPPLFEVLVPDGEPGLRSDDDIATALVSEPTVVIA